MGRGGGGTEARRESRVVLMQKRFFFAGLLCTVRDTPTRLLGGLSGMRGRTPSACPARPPPHPGSPPTLQHAHPSRSSRQSSRTRRDEALSLTCTSGGRTGAGFAHVWRQASTRAHEFVRASAHCVRAVLVVRTNGPVESTVQDVFIFEHILMIRCSSAKISHTPPVTLFT